MTPQPPLFTATVRAEAARYVATLTADWWAANGDRRPTCSTNLRDGSTVRACPVCDGGAS